jgi:hypothetical protein
LLATTADVVFLTQTRDLAPQLADILLGIGQFLLGNAVALLFLKIQAPLT